MAFNDVVKKTENALHNAKDAVVEKVGEIAGAAEKKAAEIKNSAEVKSAESKIATAKNTVADKLESAKDAVVDAVKHPEETVKKAEHGLATAAVAVKQKLHDLTSDNKDPKK